MTLDACAELVARADPDRFQSVMAAQVAARATLLPIYALNVEVTRAPWVTEEPVIAEMRLQWWRDVLEEIADDRPVRAHDVTLPLSGVLDASGALMLDRLVAARRWDIYRDTFEDAEHFEQYLEATSALLMWVAARALGEPAVSEKAMRDVGWAAGLAAFFKAIPELEARGRRPLVDGRPAAISDLARTGLARLQRGLANGACGPATYPALLAGPILRLAARQPDCVATGSLEVSEFNRRSRRLRMALTTRVPS
jgi:hypothetical protein